MSLILTGWARFAITGQSLTTITDDRLRAAPAVLADLLHFQNGPVFTNDNRRRSNARATREGRDVEDTLPVGFAARLSGGYPTGAPELSRVSRYWRPRYITPTRGGR